MQDVMGEAGDDDACDPRHLVSALSKMLMPVAGNLDPARHPDMLVAKHIIEEAGERLGAPGAAGEPAVKADRHHLGRAAAALVVEAVEAVFEIAEELVAAVEALGSGKSHVIGIER